MVRPTLLVFCSVLLACSCVAGLADIEIINQSISTTSTRDGCTLSLGYTIASDTYMQVRLGATLTGPSGEVVASTRVDPVVTIGPGTNQYFRDFLVNLPPQAQSGLYDVTWTVSWGAAESRSVTMQDVLNILPPIPVRVPILAYHKVGPIAYSSYWVQTDMFRRQMRALRAYGYTPVTLQDVMNFRAGLAVPPAKPVVITFDDGYDNWYTEAFPVLSDPSVQMKAAYCIATGRIGGNNSWDAGDCNPIINMLTWEQIQELHASGLIDFQSHTVTHPVLPNLATKNPSSLQMELRDSKATIESRLGKSCDFIVYPYGLYSLDVQRAARDAGYFAGVTTLGGIENSCADKWALKRLSIGFSTTCDYDPTNPANFFFGYWRVYDPDIPLPRIDIDSIEYLDALTGAPVSTNVFDRGQLIKIRVKATNTGQAASVIASLKLDNDNDHSTLAYDSHVAQPPQDISTYFDRRQQVFEWLWRVPENAPAGQYYCALDFYDQYYILKFRAIGWQRSFSVLGEISDIASAKMANDGITAAIQDGIVTAAFPDFFYMEDPSRVGGVRVDLAGHNFAVGMKVSVAGTIGTNADGERYIAATSATQTGVGSVRPLAMSNKALGGARLFRQEGVCARMLTRNADGSYSTTILPGSGVNNIGLLVRTWGAVKSVDNSSHTMIIDDGSGVMLKCLAPDTVILDPAWRWVVVTGISSCERTDGVITRLLRIRSPEDIVSYQLQP